MQRGKPGGWGIAKRIKCNTHDRERQADQETRPTRDNLGIGKRIAWPQIFYAYLMKLPHSAFCGRS